MGRSPCCSKEGVNRGAWTPLEDKTLTDFITNHGEGKWRSLPKRAGLKRCGKSCRLRWLNYLRPDIKRGNITPDEEDLIIRLHKLLGNRWSLIAGRLPGRTDNEIKNYWNTNIGRRLQFQADVHQSTSNGGNNQSPLIQSTSIKKNLSSSSSAAAVVVRTKASRCSKVFINSELQQQQLGNLAASPAPPAKSGESAATPPAAADDDENPQPTITITDDQSFHLQESQIQQLCPSKGDYDFLMKDFMVGDDDDIFVSNSLDNGLFMPPYSSPGIDYNFTGSYNAIDKEASSSSNHWGRHEHELFDEMFHCAELGGSMNMVSVFDTCTALDWI